MPGYDESLEIPDWLEPPRMDADETLPNMIHPSYPFGRPSTGKGKGKGKGVGGWGAGAGGGIGNLMSGQGREEERWDELGDGLIEEKKGKEVPPGMAVSRNPSPLLYQLPLLTSRIPHPTLIPILYLYILSYRVSSGVCKTHTFR